MEGLLVLKMSTMEEKSQEQEFEASAHTTYIEEVEKSWQSHYYAIIINM